MPDSIGVTLQQHVRDATGVIDEAACGRAHYRPTGVAEIAETTLGERRLIVCRTRLVAKQAALWPDWRQHAFITDRTDELAVVEHERRRQAALELAIRDHKDGALRHLPSGRYAANRDPPPLMRRSELHGAAHDTPAGRAARVVRAYRAHTVDAPTRWPSPEDPL